MKAVLVDDHPLLQIGLRLLFEEAGLSVEVAALVPAPALATWIVERQASCAVVDLNLPIEGGGLSLIGPLAAAGTRVVVLTGEADVVLWAACMERGAEVVLSKSEPLDEIVSIVTQVCRGQSVRPQQRAALALEGRRASVERDETMAPFLALSRREREVLAALMEGHSPAGIAERDFVSIQTVRTQIKALLRKLSVRSQLEAVARARAAGWRRDDHEGPGSPLNSIGSSSRL